MSGREWALLVLGVLLGMLLGSLWRHLSRPFHPGEWDFLPEEHEPDAERLWPKPAADAMEKQQRDHGAFGPRRPLNYKGE